MPFSILDKSVQCSMVSYWSIEYILFINAVQSTDFPNLIRCCDVCVTMSGKQSMPDVLSCVNQCIDFSTCPLYSIKLNEIKCSPFDRRKRKNHIFRCFYRPIVLIHHFGFGIWLSLFNKHCIWAHYTIFKNIQTFRMNNVPWWTHAFSINNWIIFCV